MATQTNKKPVHTIRYGAVRVAIWENQSANGPFLNATFERTYRDSEGKAQSAHAFGVSDLALLQLASLEAAQWMNANRASQPQQDEAA